MSPATKMPRMSSTPRIDVSIEHKHAKPDESGEKDHPNTCPSCGSHYRDDELAANLRVCVQCGHHYPVRAPERVAQLADEGSFVEDEDLPRPTRSSSSISVPTPSASPKPRLRQVLGDAILTGSASIESQPCRLAVMDFSFLGGSMGSVVGEKFVRACERAAADGTAIVSVSASGGARMQEGILALMQLPKTVCAVADLHDAGGALVSVLAHPTTGGVLASFASLGDIVLAEPGALMSFAGLRVVAQTTREKLPDDFGRSESNLRYGHLDAVVPRAELRPTIGRLLRLLGNGA